VGEGVGRVWGSRVRWCVFSRGPKAFRRRVMAVMVLLLGSVVSGGWISFL
jgi:hypothetical protein